MNPFPLMKGISIPNYNHFVRRNLDITKSVTTQHGLLQYGLQENDRVDTLENSLFYHVDYMSNNVLNEYNNSMTDSILLLKGGKGLSIYANKTPLVEGLDKISFDWDSTLIYDGEDPRKDIDPSKLKIDANSNGYKRFNDTISKIHDLYTTYLSHVKHDMHRLINKVVDKFKIDPKYRNKILDPNNLRIHTFMLYMYPPPDVHVVRCNLLYFDPDSLSIYFPIATLFEASMSDRKTLFNSFKANKKVPQSLTEKYLPVVSFANLLEDIVDIQFNATHIKQEKQNKRIQDVLNKALTGDLHPEFYNVANGRYENNIGIHPIIDISTKESNPLDDTKFNDLKEYNKHLYAKSVTGTFPHSTLPTFPYDKYMTTTRNTYMALFEYYNMRTNVDKQFKIGRSFRCRTRIPVSMNKHDYELFGSKEIRKCGLCMPVLLKIIIPKGIKLYKIDENRLTLNDKHYLTPIHITTGVFKRERPNNTEHNTVYSTMTVIVCLYSKHKIEINADKCKEHDNERKKRIVNESKIKKKNAKIAGFNKLMNDYMYKLTKRIEPKTDKDGNAKLDKDGKIETFKTRLSVSRQICGNAIQNHFYRMLMVFLATIAEETYVNKHIKKINKEHRTNLEIEYHNIDNAKNTQKKSNNLTESVMTDLTESVMTDLGESTMTDGYESNTNNSDTESGYEGTAETNNLVEVNHTIPNKNDNDLVNLFGYPASQHELYKYSKDSMTVLTIKELYSKLDNYFNYIYNNYEK